MENLAESWLFWIALIAALAVLYILPTMIAVIRQVKYLGYVIALNFIGVGWPAALICAFILPRRVPRRSSTCVQDYDAGNYPPPPDFSS